MTASPTQGVVPTAAQAAALASGLLGEVGTRLPHVLRAGRIAAHLAPLFDRGEAQLLVAAATLHDIGYAPRIAQTGFHPLDGGLYLASHGYSRRLAGLVAHHSLAHLNAPAHGIQDLDSIFPRETGLLADALMYADMHSAPGGGLIPAAQRLADIAARHTYPGTAQRLDEIRAALARVTAAAAAAGLPEPHSDVPEPVKVDLDGGPAAVDVTRGARGVPGPAAPAQLG